MQQSPSHWSSPTASIWGKTDRDDPDSGRWLPLVRHLEDSAGVAAHLFDHWLADSQRWALAQHLGGVESARTLLCFVAGLHDIGKCSPTFCRQALMASGGRFAFLIDLLRSAGFEFTDVEPAHHGVVGQVVIRDLLEDSGVPRRQPSRRSWVATMV